MVQQNSPVAATTPERVGAEEVISTLDERQLREAKRRYDELRRLAQAEPYTGMGEVG